MEEENKGYDFEGRDPSNGRFVKGNSVATRNKGKPKKLRQRFIEYVEKECDKGNAWYEGIYKVATDETAPQDFQLKAAKLVQDAVLYEDRLHIEIEDTTNYNDQDVINNILAIVGRGQAVVTEESSVEAPEEFDKDE